MKGPTVIRSRVIGCGACLPSNIVTNDDLAKKVDTSDDWIQTRTGIRERRIVAEGEKTSDLALAAAHQFLAIVAQDLGVVPEIGPLGVQDGTGRAPLGTAKPSLGSIKLGARLRDDAFVRGWRRRRSTGCQ